MAMLLSFHECSIVKRKFTLLFKWLEHQLIFFQVIDLSLNKQELVFEKSDQQFCDIISDKLIQSLYL